MSEAQPTRMTKAEWLAEGERRFGKDKMKWKFVCPACGFVASIEDYKKAGAEEGACAFSCIGRFDGHINVAMGTKPGPCNYAGGGLFRINPIKVVDEDGQEYELFAFADPPLEIPQGIQEFHAHLDVCQQCREHPMELCRTGAQLLQNAASQAMGKANMSAGIQEGP